MLNGIEEKEIRENVINSLFDKQNLIGVPTGFADLDKITKGLKRGHLIVLGGETGIGKSMLATTLSINVAKSGHNVLYLDLENGRDEIYHRLLTNWFNLDPGYFENEENKEQVDKFLDILEDKIDYWGIDDLMSFGYVDNPIKAVMGIIQQGGRNPRRKPRLIVVDPLQALERQTDPGRLYNEQGRVIEDLKNTALNKKTTIIICHHFNKGQTSGEKRIVDIDDIEQRTYRIPTLESFKGSAKILDFSQQAWGLFRKASSPDKQERSKSMLMVLKNRSGLTGNVKLYFDEDHLAFKETPVYSNIPVGTLPYQNLDVS